MSRRGRRLGLGIVIVVLVTCGMSAVCSWWFRTTFAEAKGAMHERRFTEARSRLTWLSSWWSAGGEVDLLLGDCEQATGHADAALAAWARVPSRSPFAEEAALRAGALAMKCGRFSPAERSLMTALREPGSQAIEIRRQLVPLLWAQGRTDEIRRLVEANWRQMSHPAWPRPEEATEALRTYIELGVESPAVEGIRSVLGHAGRQAPDDDRVWLGRASLATRTGRFDEAEEWLDACQRRRPDDPAVWQARLEWALACDRVESARQALGHLPADRLSSRQVLTLRAWFAEHRKDARAERDALGRLVESYPGDFAALERLAVLVAGAGQAALAAQFRERKAELDRAKHRYQSLCRDNALTTRAAEMARLAETLGYRFESLGLWTLASRRAPGDCEAQAALTRLGRAEAPRGAPGRTLDRLLDDDPGLHRNPPSAPLAHPVEPGGAWPQFRDDAPSARLSFAFESGKSGLHQLPETMSGGIGLLDYDGDGWLDVYCVQGGRFPPDRRSTREGDRLFRNRGDGSFDDATQSSGISSLAQGYGHGVAVGDYDNDGNADLFLTRWGAYALYRNRGDGTFDDATGRAGLDGGRDWPTSAAFADLDCDGDLDLYVCHYLDWDPLNPKLCLDEVKKSYISCDPRGIPSMADHVFRNDGGRFVDVSAEAGIVDRDGRGLGVVAADFDEDGRVDLFVANDGTGNFLFHNLGGFRFEEVGHAWGVAGNAEGGYQAGMGVACGDVDGDARVDLAVTNFEGESTTFYQNLGRGVFADRTAAIGLAAPSRFLLGFGAAFLDVNNDGRLDLMTANGHVNDLRPDVPYAMRVQLLLGGEGGRMTDVSFRAGPPFGVLRVGRGLATGDLDNDGRVDALVVTQDDSLAYFHNQSEGGGHSVTLRLRGKASNRDAIGARVVLTTRGHRRVAQRFGGGSYQSAGDGRIHFGLGDVRRIDWLEVRWPSGRVDRHRDLAADAGYLVREGDTEVRPLKGW